MLTRLFAVLRKLLRYLVLQNTTTSSRSLPVFVNLDGVHLTHVDLNTTALLIEI